MSWYLGRRDIVRQRGAEEEANWQRMNLMAVPVSLETFLRQVDISPLLDEEETPEEFMNSSLSGDPNTSVFASYWGDQRCWFFRSATLEFIFLK